MAIQLRSTRDIHAHGVKMLCYAFAGSGKTTLINTLPEPVILSAEAGLLSLSGSDIPFIEITDIATLRDAYNWLLSPEGSQFKSVAIDSISEIAEVVLNAERKLTKDPRQAYGAMQEQMADMIRAFRDLPNRHVYMTAKCEQQKDETGKILYSPSMPGNKTGQAMPYFFDELFALRCEKDAEGNTVRALMCQPDGLWQAKDRSGKLDAWEAPDLGEIIRKIGGEA